MRTQLIRFVCTLALTLPLAANAAMWQFSGALNTEQETVAVTTPAPYFGGGVLTASLDDVTGDFMLDVLFSGTSGPLVGQHIHAGAPGVSGPVLFPLPAPVAGPSGLSLIGFATVLSAGEMSALTGGGALGVGAATPWYVNLHTALNPTGELRGQMFVTAVPLPAAAWMLIPALGLLAKARRRS